MDEKQKMAVRGVSTLPPSCTDSQENPYKRLRKREDEPPVSYSKSTIWDCCCGNLIRRLTLLRPRAILLLTNPLCASQLQFTTDRK